MEGREEVLGADAVLPLALVVLCLVRRGGLKQIAQLLFGCLVLLYFVIRFAVLFVLPALSVPVTLVLLPVYLVRAGLGYLRGLQRQPDGLVGTDQ